MPLNFTVPAWATSPTGIANTVAPSGAKQADGWADGELPPHSTFNWAQNLIGTALGVVKAIPETQINWTQLQNFFASAFGPNIFVGILTAGARDFTQPSATLGSNGLSVSASSSTVQVNPSIARISDASGAAGRITAFETRIESAPNIGTQVTAAGAQYLGTKIRTKFFGASELRASSLIAGQEFVTFPNGGPAPYNNQPAKIFAVQTTDDIRINLGFKLPANAQLGSVRLLVGAGTSSFGSVLTAEVWRTNVVQVGNALPFTSAAVTVSGSLNFALSNTPMIVCNVQSAGALSSRIASDDAQFDLMARIVNTAGATYNLYLYGAIVEYAQADWDI